MPRERDESGRFADPSGKVRAPWFGPMQPLRPLDVQPARHGPPSAVAVGAAVIAVISFVALLLATSHHG